MDQTTIIILAFVCCLACVLFVLVDWGKVFGYVEFKKHFQFRERMTGAEIAELFNHIEQLFKETYRSSFTSMISCNHGYYTISFQAGKFVCFVHGLDEQTVFKAEKTYDGISLVASECINAPWEYSFIREQRQFLEEVLNLLKLSLNKKI